MQPPFPPPSLDDTPSEQLTSQQGHEYQVMVKDMLHDATESSIYMCGMVVVDIDDPCYSIYNCDFSLECDTLLDLEFYISRIQPRPTVLCCHCAGTTNARFLCWTKHSTQGARGALLYRATNLYARRALIAVAISLSALQDKMRPPSKLTWRPSMQGTYCV
jgi:hypothetical protein